MADPPFSSADFHNVVHKQIVNAVFETLADTKLDWALVAPFLDAARELCRTDFREGARIRLHAARVEGETTVAAEEAYLGIAVPDRENGEEWLSESYWLSDIACADGDPAEVRRIAAALERSLARIQAWLDGQGDGGPAAAAEPPSEGGRRQ